MEPQALLVADRLGVIRLWNEHATALFGYTADQAVGSTLDLVVPPAYRRRHWQGYRRAWEHGIDDEPRVALLPVLCADGEVRRFAGRLQPLRGPHGDIAAMAGIWSDSSSYDKWLSEIG